MAPYGGHVVVGHGDRDGAQFLEGHFVKIYDAFKGLICEMAVINPSAEAQYNGTGLHNGSSSSHNNLMGTPVHLPFFTRGMINGGPGFSIGSWPDSADMVFEDGILSVITECLYFLQNPYG